VLGAVATRITRDHLDWHGSLEAYHGAKGNALRAARAFVVTAADDPVAAAIPVRASRVLRYSDGALGEIGVEADWLVSRIGDAGRVLHADATRLVGGFHVENLGAAFAASQQLGAPRHAAALALCRVLPLPHRLQLLGELGGVRVFGNAVSTEVQSTVSALRSVHGRIHWVGGGKSKDGQFEPVAAQVAPWIASAHLFGAAAPELAPHLGSNVPTTVHDRLESALDAAHGAALAGDAIVFSPAFASFDQYSNFSERAAAFEAWLGRRIHTDAAHEATIGIGPGARQR
ncbi:MAG: hypothetical protein KDB80_08445, partial [Planctomycetes bacterium]|nr:hypothetical protein [Planctomycetota bacterium]